MRKAKFVMACVVILAFTHMAGVAFARTPVRQLSSSSMPSLSEGTRGQLNEARIQSQLQTERRTFLESFGENLRLSLDLSSRLAVSDSGDVAYQNVIGFDTHKVITGAGGDWATLVMQGYLTRIDNAPSYPPFFDGPDDTEFVYRILNLNITRFGRGRFNFRVGHFEIPFGLEHVLNTNGTLRDFMHGPNLGVKADWGVGVNGSWRSGEYEVTLSRGTGNTMFSAGRPYALAGRIGTLSDGNLVVGVSVFRGRVWNPGATALWAEGVQAGPGSLALLDEVVQAGMINRYRVGADIQWYRGLNAVLAEVAIGGDSGPDDWSRQGVANALFEVSRRNSDERLAIYFQGRLFSRDRGADWGSSFSGAWGTRFAVDNHWAVSGEYARTIVSAAGTPGGMLRSQIRYRF